MRILIGCETSGVVRRAFAARGHGVGGMKSNLHIHGLCKTFLLISMLVFLGRGMIPPRAPRGAVSPAKGGFSS